jgi:hypothetical protein
MYIEPKQTIERKQKELSNVLKRAEKTRIKYGKQLDAFCALSMFPSMARVCVHTCKQRMKNKIPTTDEYLFGERLPQVNVALSAYVAAKKQEHEALTELSLYNSELSFITKFQSTLLRKNFYHYEKIKNQT